MGQAGRTGCSWLPWPCLLLFHRQWEARDGSFLRHRLQTQRSQNTKPFVAALLQSHMIDHRCSWFLSPPPPPTPLSQCFRPCRWRRRRAFHLADTWLGNTWRAVEPEERVDLSEMLALRESSPGSRPDKVRHGGWKARAVVATHPPWDFLRSGWHQSLAPVGVQTWEEHIWSSQFIFTLTLGFMGCGSPAAIRVQFPGP